MIEKISEFDLDIAGYDLNDKPVIRATERNMAKIVKKINEVVVFLNKNFPEPEKEVTIKED